MDDEDIVLKLGDLAAMLCFKGLRKEWLQPPKQRRLKYLPVPLRPEGAQKQGSVSLLRYWKLEFMKAKRK